MGADITEKQTLTEMTESLTGFEEIAVEKHMGIDVYRDGETMPIRVLRGLIFVDLIRHGGVTAPEAVKQAQEMPMGKVTDYFADEPDEVDPDEPETPVGEDSLPFDEGPSI